ncbi:hypothetical protein HMPREF9439_00003 [Parasutterella excrementihominis YIT 11859]|uniref:Uncharacterized protein n=1 Tax=Parasutterella excrementihominis YIT 11859 TaxID=762966 RepID=F3QGG5_9BURK|nr:hypothetical protein HMPREF9439_00003 [Parasutterella excrementihominis YIT 11859]
MLNFFAQGRYKALISRDFHEARIQQTGISTVAPDLDTNKYLIEKNGIFKEES